VTSLLAIDYMCKTLLPYRCRNKRRFTKIKM